ncbi:MAG: two-component regulator propeller domain-containing protein [bacterium]
MKKLAIFTLFSILNVCGTGVAGNLQDKISFRHLTIDDGLSQSAVYALLQDRQGFVWIGTKDGLNRYDGYDFTIYKNVPSDSNSLSNNYITALFEDSRGYLWAGTLEGGLNRLDPTSGHFQRYSTSVSDPGSLSSNRITALSEDSSGALWIGTSNGLNRLTADEIERPDPTFDKFFHHPENPRTLSHNVIAALLVDQQDNLWVGTTNGLNRLTRHDTLQSGVFVHYFSEEGGDEGLMDSRIYSLYQGQDGSIWAGTASGLNRVQPETGAIQPFPHHFRTYRRGWGNVVDIAEDENGHLWLATPDELMIFDPLRQHYQSVRSQKMNPRALNSNHLTRLFRDRSGVFWIGTNGYGLNLYDPRADRFLTYRRPLDFPSRINRFSISALLEDRQGNLWISADVLYRWNRSTGELTSFETDSEHPEDFGNTGSWSMLQDRRGFIWLAGFEGLYRYNPETRNYRHFTHGRGLQEKVAFQVYLDRDERIWVATENYLSCYDSEADRFSHYRYRQNPATRFVSLTAVYQDGSGIFWLATDDGLASFDPQTETFRYRRNDPRDANTLSNNVVLSITPAPTRSGILWLGTAGGGLNRFNRETETFRAITAADGLPNDVVYAALPDKAGNLWLSTNKGLSCFTPATTAFRNFDVSDGLQSNEFNTGAYFLSPSGEMFFGGIKGLNHFYPENIVDNPHIPNVVFTGLRLFNQVISPQTHPQILDTLITYEKQVNLSHRDNVIAFEFSALDFSAPSRNQFAYRMVGFDERWIPSGTGRLATYTHLPAGDYLFQVKGSNNDGVWNEQGATLAIHISAPPWKTWWAYSLYLLAVVTLLYGLRRYEMNRLQLKNRLQMERVDGEKLRELDQLKTRFFANISHEFRTPLTLIVGPLQQLMDKVPDEESQRMLGMMQRNTRRLLQLINQLLDLSKLDAGKMELYLRQGDLVSFLRGALRSYDALAETKKIDVRFSTERESFIMLFDHDKMENIFHNLLANAFKFTPDGGEVSLSLGFSQSAGKPASVVVTVADNGTGIPAQRMARIFDRFFQADENGGEKGGSGIGLALVKELVALQRGEISVQSQVGEGTTFTVTLPVENAEIVMSEARAKEAPAKSDRKTPAQLSAGRENGEENRGIVLVIEDNRDMRAFIRTVLRVDYEVLEAPDGRAGIEQAAQATPDLIISDLMMPKMDGYELCRELKNDQKTSHIPIILLTARAAAEDKITGLQAGVDDYLIKPFQPEELLARVHNLIAVRKNLIATLGKKALLSPSELAVTPVDQAFLEKVREVIEREMGDETFGVETLCAEIALSERQFRRKLKALTGQTPNQVIRTMRLQRARQMLEQNAATIAEIAFLVGFGSPAYFTKMFREEFGRLPSEVGDG